MTTENRTSSKDKRVEITTKNVNDMLFPVTLVDFEEKFGIPANPSCKSAIIAEIDGKEKTIATCGEYYNLVDNNMFAEIEAQFALMGVEYEVTYSMVNYEQFTAKYTLKSYKGRKLSFKIADGDTISPILNIRKSYSGILKYAFLFGFYRWICENGLVSPVEEMERFNFNYVGKHTDKLVESIETLQSKIESYLHFVDNNNVIEKFVALSDKKVENYGDRVEEVMNACNISMGKASKDDTRGKNFYTVLEQIESEMAELNTQASDWLIYNGINHYLYNNNVKTDETREKKDSEVLSFIMNGKPKKKKAKVTA